MLNETQIGDVWLLFADYIDKKVVDSVAERYVELLADFGVTDKVLGGATGIDGSLDNAIEYYLDEEVDEDEIDDDYNEEDEDY
jgi:hypothetical protein